MVDLAGFTEDHLDKEQFSCFTVFLLKLWFAMVPPGVRAPFIDVEELADRCDNELFEFAEAMATSPNRVEEYLAAASQPGLLRAVYGMVLEEAKQEPLRHCLDAPAVANSLSLLKAVMEELDHHLRPSRG